MPTENTNQKLLLVITKTDFGGAQRYVFEIASAMQNKGYLVAVAGGGNGNLLDKLQAENIQTFSLNGVQRNISLWAEIKSLISLWRTIRDFKPDIVHLNSSKVGVLGSIVARLLGVKKIIFTAHGWPFLEQRSIWWRTMAWCGSYLTALLVHKVILVSQNDLRHTHMPGTGSKQVVIPISVPEFTTLAREEARLALFGKKTLTAHSHNIWLGTIGELNHNKNHSAVIDAVAEFNSTRQVKIFFTIISDGELRASLEEQIDLKGLNEYVFLVGHKAEARQYLSAFDIFILPSKKEGLPYSLIEAGQCGLPCIASFVGGIPEVITNLESGLLVDPNNHMSIVKAFEFYLDHPNERVKFGTALKQHVSTNFSQSKMLTLTEAVYNSNL